MAREILEWQARLEVKNGRTYQRVSVVRFGMLVKYASLFTIVFAVSTLLFAQNTKAALTVTAFDGTWSVTVDFHEYRNPDGSVAHAWVKHFSAKVKNGVLHGELGTR